MEGLANGDSENEDRQDHTLPVTVVEGTGDLTWTKLWLKVLAMQSQRNLTKHIIKAKQSQIKC